MEFMNEIKDGKIRPNRNRDSNNKKAKTINNNKHNNSYNKPFFYKHK